MGELSPDVESVQHRLEQIKRRRRSGIRWRITEHTAELALAALRQGKKRGRKPLSAKSRRRKRHKRLL